MGAGREARPDQDAAIWRFAPRACAAPSAPLKVLIILGHPRPQSLCGALAAAYRAGAEEAGAIVQELRLSELAFAPDVTTAIFSRQTVEHDIRRARDLILWADHLVFVYPTWWGTMPARLKGFLDRVLAPGFAFADAEGGSGFEGLLGGRTAEILTTMDTPRWVYRWIFGAPGHRAMRHAILGFCGVEVVRVTSFGPVKGSMPQQRAAWVRAARAAGARLGQGPWSARQRALRKVGNWLRAARLQFYPMTWLAYTAGAFAAPGAGLDPAPFWFGLFALLFIEIATVLSNDYFDFASDIRNRNFGPFTGGSRVLVEGRLTFREVELATAAALVVALGFGLLTAAASAGSAAAAGGALSLMAVLALGYTMPPLKLSWRGFGELDVGFTHGIGAMLCGFVFQGGALLDPGPWLLGLPLSLAVLPGIILSGIPDHDADRAAGKGTMAVRAGIRAAYLYAGLAALAAAGSALALALVGAAGGAFRLLPWAALPHLALVLVVLARRLGREPKAERIDGVMVAALSYTVWFALLPLIELA